MVLRALCRPGASRSGAYAAVNWYRLTLSRGQKNFGSRLRAHENDSDKSCSLDQRDERSVMA
eukprot:5064486-Prymnesium_polylepis.1